VPGIHVFLNRTAKGVDGRDKPGHGEYDVALSTALAAELFYG
jgi:hypothetical protein